MTNVAKTSVARVGNSHAIIIPKEFLMLLGLEPKDKVEVFKNDDGLYIKPLPKKKEWSQEAQARAAEEFIKTIIEMPDGDETLLNDFVEQFKFRGRKFDETMFEELDK